MVIEFVFASKVLFNQNKILCFFIYCFVLFLFLFSDQFFNQYEQKLVLFIYLFLLHSLYIESKLDEIICECRHDDVEKVCALIKAVMESSGPVLSVPFTVQLKMGSSLGTLV
jgi:hypothetical protein